MVFSSLGYALSGDDKGEIEKVNHNNIEFVRDANSDYWRFVINEHEFITQYNPQEVADISFFSTLTLQNYINKPLYFVGGFAEANVELGRNLNPFVLRFNEACLDSECKGDFPIKNCSEDNVLIFNEVSSASDDENILQQDNCIFITSSISNQTRYTDALLFDLLGIK